MVALVQSLVSCFRHVNQKARLAATLWSSCASFRNIVSSVNRSTTRSISRIGLPWVLPRRREGEIMRTAAPRTEASADAQTELTWLVYETLRNTRAWIEVLARLQRLMTAEAVVLGWHDVAIGGRRVRPSGRLGSGPGRPLRDRVLQQESVDADRTAVPGAGDCGRRGDSAERRFDEDRVLPGVFETTAPASWPVRMSSADGDPSSGT